MEKDQLFLLQIYHFKHSLEKIPIRITNENYIFQQYGLYFNYSSSAGSIIASSADSIITSSANSIKTSSADSIITSSADSIISSNAGSTVLYFLTVQTLLYLAVLPLFVKQWGVLYYLGGTMTGKADKSFSYGDFQCIYIYTVYSTCITVNTVVCTVCYNIISYKVIKSLNKIQA